MMARKISIVSILTLFMMLSCQNKEVEIARSKRVENNVHLDNESLSRDKKDINRPDSIVTSRIHTPNRVLCDLDGDNLIDTVLIVQNTINEKYGLEFNFGNKKIDYLGLGNDILGQGFDDINWASIFEKVPRGGIYWNNVNDNGEIITDEEVREMDKIKLENDGIFIHQLESCGGGIVYLNNGKFAWIQQE